MSAVLDWVKANVFIVVFAVIMVAAAVVLPLLSAKMNAQVKTTVSQRVQLMQQLTQLQKGEIVPGHAGLPNERTLQSYEEIARVMGEDAAAVQTAALEHNRKGRETIRPVVRNQQMVIFPEAPAADMDVIPLKFHEALIDTYGALLHGVRAGMPPAPEDLRQELQNTETQFITQDLRKSKEETLTPEEQKQLTEKLSSVRMSLYVEAARNVGLYVSMDVLGVPQWNQTSQPSHGELFTWQWQYWVVDDILKAVSSANRDIATVLDAPVKHVQLVEILDVPVPGASQSGATGGAAGGGVAAGDNFAGTGMGAMGDGGAAPAGPTLAGVEPNPAAPLQSQFGASITGRVTNPLYDVINARVQLIVETRRLPQVLDAVAKYNFMTVTGLTLKAVDPFEAAQSGFFYGSEAVAEVDMIIETIWLRAWVREFMPVDVKRTLSIPVKPAQPANAPSTDA